MGNQKSKMPDVGEKTLCMDDKQDVLEALFDARGKWEEIGGALRMKESDLEVIKLEERGDCEKCLNRLVTRWLNDGRNCTWGALADALRNVTVNKPDVARQIDAHRQSHSQHSGARALVFTAPPNADGKWGILICIGALIGVK